MVLLIFFILLVPSLTQAQVEYLATYEGSGTEADPFRAHSGIRGTECKSLRATEKSAAGWAYCVGPSLPARAGVINLSGKRLLVKAERDKILSDSGLSVSSSTVEGLLSELVDSQGVSLKRTAGRQRIVVKGREVWSRPAPLSSYLRDIPAMVAGLFESAVAMAASTLSENFETGGVDDTTSPFVAQHSWVSTGGTAHGIKSNKYEVTNSVSVHETYSTTTLDSTDMQVRAVLNATRGSATNIGGAVTGRHDGTGTPTFVYCMGRDAATPFAEYGQKVAGALTVHGTVNTTISAGSTITLTALGDQISCAVDGVVVLGPLTDNTGSGNVRVGTRTQGSGTATTAVVTLDDLYAALASERRPIAPLVLQ